MDEISEDKVSVLKEGGFFKSLRNYFREYCNCTGVHGFRYFGEKRTIFERVWWFIVFVICLSACSFSIYLVYQKWETSPVIVSFATRGTPIYQIPFPAVTICPESKSVQSLFNYTRLLERKEYGPPLTPKENRYFEYMSLICNYRQELTYSKNTSFSDDFFDDIARIKPNFQIRSCEYMSERTKSCDHYFVPIITDEGICYTFNMLDRTEVFNDNVLHYSDYHKIRRKSANWSLDEGYQEGVGIETYPKRALYSGAKNAFSFQLWTPKQDLDYACKNSLQGYRVLLHTAMRMPRPSQDYFRIPLDQAVVGSIQPVMITTSESVKLYNPRRRECYFPFERQLKYFKVYTSLNCLMECLTNFTRTYCGCVNFFMPRENGTKICGTGQIGCMDSIERRLQMRDLKVKLELTEKKDNPPKDPQKSNKNKKVFCDCLPICTDLSYDVETSQTNWEWEKQIMANKRYREANESLENLHMSSLTLYFKTNNFITSQRNELYGPTDFLANFGGLLGLFTGFSVLSLMEIIYFLTVRLCCNTRLYGYWAGPAT